MAKKIECIDCGEEFSIVEPDVYDRCPICVAKFLEAKA